MKDDSQTKVPLPLPQPAAAAARDEAPEAHTEREQLGLGPRSVVALAQESEPRASLRAFLPLDLNRSLNPFADQALSATSPDGLRRGFNALTELPHRLSAARTLGFGTWAGAAMHSGAMWISPLVPQPREFPNIWIRAPRDARHVVPRSRTRRLLDRLCGLDAERPPKAVIVVAHPDDEVVGAGARLREMHDAVVVHVTDGAPRDPAYALRKGFASRDAYAQSRQDELGAVFSLLGIPQNRTLCLEVVDGEATDRLVELTYRVADILDELRPEIVITHPYEGGHTDHDATTFAVHLACGVLRREGAPAPVIFELTSYHLYRSVRRVCEFLPFGGLEERTVALDRQTQHLKQRLYDCFVSQRECLSHFPRDREMFRLAPRYIFTNPPHSGPLLYEMEARPFDGTAWRAAALRALERLRAKKNCDSGIAA